MLFGFWSWVLVVLIVAVIFSANRLPELKKVAQEKFGEGKVLLEKSKKELEAKANVLAEKAKEKKKIVKQVKTEKKIDIEEQDDISAADLAFMSEEELKKTRARTKK